MERLLFARAGWNILKFARAQKQLMSTYSYQVEFGLKYTVYLYVNVSMRMLTYVCIYIYCISEHVLRWNKSKMKDGKKKEGVSGKSETVGRERALSCPAAVFF